MREESYFREWNCLFDNIVSPKHRRKRWIRKKPLSVQDLESMLDRYEDKLGDYLFKITGADLDDEQSLEVNKYLRVLSDFERMSDHARNIGEAVNEINEKKILLSDAAQKELRVLEDAVSEITKMTIDAFINNDTDLALRVDPLEEVIDDLCDAIKAHHVERMSKQECPVENKLFKQHFSEYAEKYELA